jgi:hypothetical protein
MQVEFWQTFHNMAASLHEGVRTHIGGYIKTNSYLGVW